jgi:hypothetical protein
MKNKIKYILAIIGVLIAIAIPINDYVIILNPVLYTLSYFDISLPINILMGALSYFLLGLLFEKKGLKKGILYTILILIALFVIVLILNELGVGCLC